MKHLILSLSTIVILLNMSVTHAIPLKLPSRSQLIKLIKKVDSGGLGIVGLSDWKDCDKVSINSVKILKIGRATSSFYKDSGDYTGSHFMVKLKATGTCTFNFKHTFYADIDNDGHKDSIEGTLPIINEPLEVRIRTDSYDDWVAGSLNFAGDSKELESPRIKQHIKKVFMRGKAAMGGNRYTSRVVINSIKPGQGKGKYYDGFAASTDTLSGEHDYVSIDHIQRTFGSSYRAADWEDLVNYSKSNGDVFALFKHLGIPLKEGVFITTNGWSFGKYVAVHCSKFDSKKYFIPHPRNRRNLSSQPLCLAVHYDRTKAKILAVNKSKFGEDGHYKVPRSTTSYTSTKPNTPVTTPFNSSKSPAPQGMTNDKQINEIILLFKQRPKAFKVFQQQSEAVRYRLFKRIYERKTKAERRKAFLNIANSLENGGKQRTSSGSNRHSHGGRVHTHKLPRQGKAHRHGNGPIGR